MCAPEISRTTPRAGTRTACSHVTALHDFEAKLRTIASRGKTR
jgi:hypothetical protein